MHAERFVVPLALAQVALGARIAYRFLRRVHGQRAAEHDAPLSYGDQISVIIPVLNEYERLAPCLDGLTAQGPEVGEILVVDGGSDDGTQLLAQMYAARDTRVRLIDANPVPNDWNGKAWGLQVGLRNTSAASEWVLTIDADVRPAPALARSLVAHAHAIGIPALSVATRQELATLGEGCIHPALLSTLVYRFGPPGYVTTRIAAVQANGQCFLVRRQVLEHCGGFVKTRASRCEDMTLARTLAAAGYPVGFYEAGDLVLAKMYADGRDVWRNWPRSLPLRDQYSDVQSIIGLIEVTLAQALPLPLLVLLCLAARPEALWWRALFGVNGVLLALRLGVLGGTAHAYRNAPWSYWLSPICDVPVAIQLWRSIARRRHIWRGRVLVREGHS